LNNNNKSKKKFNFKEKFKSFENLKNIKVSSSVLAIIILCLLLVCAYVLFFEINDYRKIREEKHDLYYYFISQKIEFEGTLSVNGADRIVGLKSDNVAINSTPVYYSDYPNEVILPGNMEIIFPYKRMPMYKLGSYSKLYYKNNALYVNSESGNGRIYDCFLYDGQNLYVFLERTVIKVGEQEYVLSPLSFVEIDKNYMRIYDYQTDKYTFIDSPTEQAFAYTDEYMIELSNDSFTYGTSYYLLIKSVDALDLYEF